jgi:hypothetical protein
VHEAGENAKSHAEWIFDIASVLPVSPGVARSAGHKGGKTMPRTRMVGLGLGALLLVGCQPAQPTGSPISLTPGTREYDLRQQELRSATGDPTRAQQNPIVTGASPGVGGIERAPGTGTGGAGAGAPMSVSPGVGGIERAPGVGAPTR